jgi:hypothetical protein
MPFNTRSLKDRLDLCSINTGTLGYQTPISESIEAVARHGFGAICPWRRELEGVDTAVTARQIRRPESVGLLPLDLYSGP